MECSSSVQWKHSGAFEISRLGKDIKKWQGVIFIVLYVAYIAYIIIREFA